MISKISEKLFQTQDNKVDKN